MVKATETRTSKEAQVNADSTKQKKEIRDVFMKKIDEIEQNEKMQASQVKKEKEVGEDEAKKKAEDDRRQSKEDEQAAISSAQRAEDAAKKAAVDKKAAEFR